MVTITKHVGKNASVTKYVFDFETAVAEAVLYKYPSFKERTVVCCSVQSGCPIGCTFCGTGRKFIRNLTCTEILQQIHHCFSDNAIDAEKVDRLQIMFMSMGEPLLNMPNLSLVLRNLTWRFPRSELLVSTMGPKTPGWQEFFEISEYINNLGLQFSVHETVDFKRDSLIPYASKFNLAEIADAGLLWHEFTGRKPFINYCVKESNCSHEDAKRLLSLFPPSAFNYTLSVVCEKNETVKASVERQLLLIADFKGKIMALGGPACRIFNPAGQDDIGGGCGQLWHTQKWMQEHGV